MKIFRSRRAQVDLIMIALCSILAVWITRSGCTCSIPTVGAAVYSLSDGTFPEPWVAYHAYDSHPEMSVMLDAMPKSGRFAAAITDLDIRAGCVFQGATREGSPVYAGREYGVPNGEPMTYSDRTVWLLYFSTFPGQRAIVTCPIMTAPAIHGFFGRMVTFARPGRVRFRPGDFPTPAHIERVLFFTSDPIETEVTGIRDQSFYGVVAGGYEITDSDPILVAKWNDMRLQSIQTLFLFFLATALGVFGADFFGELVRLNSCYNALDRLS